jgi:DNA polymerase-3 subunit delta'
LEPEEGIPSEDEASGSGAKTSKKSQISVDQVRQLSEFVSLSSHRAGLRIVLLHPAEALNQSSANALLKMLEEPPPGVVFLLVTSQPQRLLATITSRCSKIEMPLPSRGEAADWLRGRGVEQVDAKLAFAGGAPLLALQLSEESSRSQTGLQSLLGQGGGMNALVASAQCVPQGMFNVIDQLQKWTYDLLALRLAGQSLYHIEAEKSLQALAKTVDLQSLLVYQQILCVPAGLRSIRSMWNCRWRR